MPALYSLDSSANILGILFDILLCYAICEMLWWLLLWNMPFLRKKKT